LYLDRKNRLARALKRIGSRFGTEERRLQQQQKPHGKPRAA